MSATSHPISIVPSIDLDRVPLACASIRQVKLHSLCRPGEGYAVRLQTTCRELPYARRITHLLLSDAVLTSKWNKPFPVTLIPSAIGLYLAERQGERQRQILAEIRALGENDIKQVEKIADQPK